MGPPIRRDSTISSEMSAKVVTPKSQCPTWEAQKNEKKLQAAKDRETERAIFRALQDPTLYGRNDAVYFILRSLGMPVIPAQNGFRMEIEAQERPALFVTLRKMGLRSDGKRVVLEPPSKEERVLLEQQEDQAFDPFAGMNTPSSKRGGAGGNIPRPAVFGSSIASRKAAASNEALSTSTAALQATTALESVGKGPGSLTRASTTSALQSGTAGGLLMHLDEKTAGKDDPYALPFQPLSTVERLAQHRHASQKQPFLAALVAAKEGKEQRSTPKGKRKQTVLHAFYRLEEDRQNAMLSASEKTEAYLAPPRRFKPDEQMRSCARLAGPQKRKEQSHQRSHSHSTTFHSRFSTAASDILGINWAPELDHHETGQTAFCRSAHKFMCDRIVQMWDAENCINDDG
mmetsp:Transcript_11574/g.25460  ORF Transcript_11574/g.25460 Transcript_11574/m.25460 type:complete len:402 (-) Transcript_11574:62-1267(-)